MEPPFSMGRPCSAWTDPHWPRDYHRPGDQSPLSRRLAPSFDPRRNVPSARLTHSLASAWFSTNAGLKPTGRNAIGLRSNDCSAKAVYQARPRRLPTKSLCARVDWQVGRRRRTRRDLRLSGRGSAQQCRQAIRPDDLIIASRKPLPSREGAPGGLKRASGFPFPL